jgi:hypothetical protein
MTPKEVKIFWIDPGTATGWVAPADYYRIPDLEIITKGFLVQENKEEGTIVVAQSIGKLYKDGDEVMNPTTIPRHAIQEIREEGSSDE